MKQMRLLPLARASACLLILGGTGCHLNVFCPDPPHPGGTAQTYAHVVSKRGETLSHIAEWYTGSSHNWRKILASNPGLKVNRIQIGDTIQIPAAIVMADKIEAAPTLPSTEEPQAAGSIAPDQPTDADLAVLRPEPALKPSAKQSATLRRSRSSAAPQSAKNQAAKNQVAKNEAAQKQAAQKQAAQKQAAAGGAVAAAGTKKPLAAKHGATTGLNSKAEPPAKTGDVKSAEVKRQSPMKGDVAAPGSIAAASASSGAVAPAKTAVAPPKSDVQEEQAQIRIAEEIARLKEETIAIKIDNLEPRASLAAPPESAAPSKAVEAPRAAPPPAASEPAAPSSGGGSRIVERPVGGPSLQVESLPAPAAEDPNLGTLFTCKADDCSLKVVD